MAPVWRTQRCPRGPRGRPAPAARAGGRRRVAGRKPPGTPDPAPPATSRSRETRYRARGRRPRREPRGALHARACRALLRIFLYTAARRTSASDLLVRKSRLRASAPPPIVRRTTGAAVGASLLALRAGRPPRWGASYHRACRVSKRQEVLCWVTTPSCALATITAEVSGHRRTRHEASVIRTERVEPRPERLRAVELVSFQRDSCTPALTSAAATPRMRRRARASGQTRRRPRSRRCPRLASRPSPGPA